MSETRGIFGLNDAVEQKLDNEWVPLDQVFGGNTRFSDGSTVQALHNVGYIIGGGYTPSYPNARETCDRIQFANDTGSQVPGTLNETTDNTVSTSSLTAAYRSGGGTLVHYQILKRLPIQRKRIIYCRRVLIYLFLK